MDDRAWRSSRDDCRPLIADRAAAGNEATRSFSHAGAVVQRGIAKYQRTFDTSICAFRHSTDRLPRLHQFSHPAGDFSPRRHTVPNPSRESEPCHTLLPTDSGVAGAPRTPATPWAPAGQEELPVQIPESRSERAASLKLPAIVPTSQRTKSTVAKASTDSGQQPYAANSTPRPRPHRGSNCKGRSFTIRKRREQVGDILAVCATEYYGEFLSTAPARSYVSANISFAKKRGFIRV